MKKSTSKIFIIVFFFILLIFIIDVFAVQHQQDKIVGIYRVIELKINGTDLCSIPGRLTMEFKSNGFFVITDSETKYWEPKHTAIGTWKINLFNKFILKATDYTASMENLEYQSGEYNLNEYKRLVIEAKSEKSFSYFWMAR
jgi:hypothetical protein